jgi:hypothetical protein
MGRPGQKRCLEYGIVRGGQRSSCSQARGLQAKHHDARKEGEVGEALHRAQKAGGARRQAAASLGLAAGEREQGWGRG